jgi:hypothetical protein
MRGGRHSREGYRYFFRPLQVHPSLLQSLQCKKHLPADDEPDLVWVALGVRLFLDDNIIFSRRAPSPAVPDTPGSQTGHQQVDVCLWKVGGGSFRRQGSQPLCSHVKATEHKGASVVLGDGECLSLICFCRRLHPVSPLRGPEAMVGTGNEESNDYFAHRYWDMQKGNDYFIQLFCD